MPKIKKPAVPTPVPSVSTPDPLWEGPHPGGLESGITSSLLSKYLQCKERFRILTILGLSGKQKFSSAMDFGNMWHCCEEYYDSSKPSYWQTALEHLSKQMKRRYPMDQEEITHWHSKCGPLFAAHNSYWQESSANDPGSKGRQVVMREKVFSVPYILPSKRLVLLRGKWDGLDILTDSGRPGLYLVENKTKSQISREKVGRQLTFDLQTMLYLTAFYQADLEKVGLSETTLPLPPGVKGVYYKVVRRSSHKTAESMMKKVEEDVSAGRGSEWFDRWKVLVTPGDVDKFRKTCLDPVLENLYDDYEWWCFCREMGESPFDLTRRPSRSRYWAFPDHTPRHYRQPFMGYNPLDEDSSTVYDDYLANGSTLGLVRPATLFPELQEGGD